MLQSHRSEMDIIYIYIYIYIYYVHICSYIYAHIYIMLIYYAHVNVHHVPKCMSCHKVTVVITGRAHCFHDCIYVYIYINIISISISIYIYTYGIHHWRILWRSYRKVEPTTTEFRSNALIDSAIRPWVQLVLRANFVQLLQFHLFI